MGAMFGLSKLKSEAQPLRFIPGGITWTCDIIRTPEPPPGGWKDCGDLRTLFTNNSIKEKQCPE